MGNFAADGTAITFVDAESVAGLDVGAREARRRQALESVFGAGFGRGIATPFMVVEDHVIACPVAIRFFRKDFGFVSRQLHLEYRYRFWNGFDNALLDRYAAIIITKLAAIDVFMQNNITRLRKLLEQQGHAADLTLWPNALKVDVPIIAAHARTYLDMLANMDTLFTLSGTASLLGVINSAQRADIEYGCKKSVRAFRSVLQSEGARLYGESERIVKAHQQAKAHPPVQAALRAEGKAASAFQDRPLAQGDGEEPVPGMLVPSETNAEASLATA